MIKLTAQLHFPLSAEGRTVPIYSNYRPLFKFGEMYVSGAIITDEDTIIHPGEAATVDVYIHSDNLIGAIKKGQIISFWEPPVKIGDITVTDVGESFQLNQSSR